MQDLDIEDWCIPKKQASDPLGLEAGCWAKPPQGLCPAECHQRTCGNRSNIEMSNWCNIPREKKWPKNWVRGTPNGGVTAADEDNQTPKKIYQTWIIPFIIVTFHISQNQTRVIWAIFEYSPCQRQPRCPIQPARLPSWSHKLHNAISDLDQHYLHTVAFMIYELERTIASRSHCQAWAVSGPTIPKS